MLPFMLKVDHATKNYHAGTTVRGIKDISFSIQPGEIICVLGTSGSGKSTLLRAIAGLEEIESGSITLDKQKLSYVSQEYTLWPHLTVKENLTLAPGLLQQGSVGQREAQANELLRRFSLSDCAYRFPAELSGGQRQRVALLRAVMVKPGLLLLDEITSALDPELTKSVLDLVRALAKDGYAMIIVTHHMSFAMSVADRILFMRDGGIVRDQSSSAFFADTSDPEIRSFVLDIAKRDDSIEIFRGAEQFQAYHLALMKRLPEDSTIYVAGAVGDRWSDLMGSFYQAYEDMRIKKRITWKMMMYEQGENDKRLAERFPSLNQFRQMPRTMQNPANYNVFQDTVITQIFDGEPTIIQIKNPHIATAYLRFFEELWEAGK
jgi:ABC-type polar amino acid transport system ATPase subunit